MPESAREHGASGGAAQGAGGVGVHPGLSFLFPVMTYADNRGLRREMYEAYVTRASDQGPTAGRWDNLRHGAHPGAAPRAGAAHGVRELRAIARWPPRWRPDPDQVLEFLHDMAPALAAARRGKRWREVCGIRARASRPGEPGGLGYRLLLGEAPPAPYSLSQEDLKPLLPQRTGAARHVRLSRAPVRACHQRGAGVETWHQDVRFFEICDAMASCAVSSISISTRRQQARRRLDGRVHQPAATVRWDQHPVAYLTCNFARRSASALRCSPMTRYRRCSTSSATDCTIC